MNGSVHLIPTLRILFYGDSSETDLAVVRPGTPLRHQTGEFGLRILKDLLETSLFPQITVDYVNRFWDVDQNGAIKSPRRPQAALLTSQLLSNYDEVWFFGQHLKNFNDPPRAHADAVGYPESELTPPELADLASWMDAGGGVLMLGDHSNTWDNSGQLLNLGRALGHAVRRAGEMRVWVGPPGAYRSEGQINTSGDTPDMADMPRQEDAIGQRVFPKFWEVVNRWTAIRFWHPLFVGSPRPGNPLGLIDLFPDHGHDGALNLPGSFPASVWPQTNKGVQPRPQVVATGIDQNTGKPVDLVSAYDGHMAGVGRIVAHNTFHHFVNVNLQGFRNPDGSPTETLKIITQYYMNLATYLAPWERRVESLRKLLHKLAAVSVVRDLQGAPIAFQGRSAFRVAGGWLNQGQIQDLLNAAHLEVVPPTPERNIAEGHLLHMEDLLGGLLAETIDHLRSGQGELPADVAPQVQRKGIVRAYKTRAEEHEWQLQELRAQIHQWIC